MDPTIFLIGGMFVVLYFVSIRPQQKRAREHAALLASLTEGTDVITVSGMHGRVVAVADSHVDLEVTADGVVLRFQKAAIREVVRPDEVDLTEVDEDSTGSTSA